MVDDALLLGGNGQLSADDNASLTLSLLAILGRRGVTIIVLIICACAVVIIAFLLATVCVARRRRRRRYQKAAAGPASPPPSCNGDKYNCRVETLRAISESTTTTSRTPHPSTTSGGRASQQTRPAVRTLDCSPRTPSGRVVLVAGGGTGLTAARWDTGTAGCRRQLMTAPSVNDHNLSTFGKTLPPGSRTLSTGDVTSATPDVKVRQSISQSFAIAPRPHPTFRGASQ